MSFNIGEIVVYRQFLHESGDVCEITGVLYECRIGNGSGRGLIRAGTKQLRLATPEERVAFVAAQTQKLDKQIAELMAYRKQLEDEFTD